MSQSTQVLSGIACICIILEKFKGKQTHKNVNAQNVRNNALSLQLFIHVLRHGTFQFCEYLVSGNFDQCIPLPCITQEEMVHFIPMQQVCTSPSHNEQVFQNIFYNLHNTFTTYFFPRVDKVDQIKSPNSSWTECTTKSLSSDNSNVDRTNMRRIQCMNFLKSQTVVHTISNRFNPSEYTILYRAVYFTQHTKCSNCNNL